MGIANQNSQMGLRPASTVDGCLTASVEYGHIPKSNTQDLYVGMLVKIDGTGAGALPVFSGQQAGGANQPDPYQGSNAGLYPDVSFIAPGAGNNIWGVIVGFEFDGDLARSGTKYLPAGTEGLVRVNTSPDAIYEIAVDTVLTAADVGANIDLTAVAAVQMFGYSGQQLAAGTLGAGATLPLRLLRPKNVPTNEVGVNNAIWYVRVNTSDRYSSVGVA